MRDREAHGNPNRAVAYQLMAICGTAIAVVYATSPEGKLSYGYSLSERHDPSHQSRTRSEVGDAGE